VSGVVQDMIAPRPTEGWFGQATGLLDDVGIRPDDARKARQYIRRRFDNEEAAFLFHQLGIEEPS
jgi:hypothetical protein